MPSPRSTRATMALRLADIASKFVTMLLTLPSDVRSLRLRAMVPRSRIQSTGGSPWKTVVASGSGSPAPSSSSR